MSALDRRELATILAALAWYGKFKSEQPDTLFQAGIEDIANDAGELEPLDLEGVESLAEKLNLAEAIALLERPANTKKDKAYRARAMKQYGSDDIEIDIAAKVSQGDSGAFVEAWVWVSDEDY